MSDINHEYTDEIVCPYCGYEFDDSWEYNQNGEELGLIECSRCEKSFYGQRSIEITYVTEKAKYGTCKCCKSKKVVIENYHGSIGNYTDLCVECGKKEKKNLLKKYMDKISKTR